jgi:hypothetical protein
MCTHPALYRELTQPALSEAEGLTPPLSETTGSCQQSQVIQIVVLPAALITFRATLDECVYGHTIVR